MNCDKDLLKSVFSKEIKPIKTDFQFNNNKETLVYQAPNEDSDLLKQKKDRCCVCNKKLRTCVLQCKCELVFCSAHISDTAHNCTFDYKLFGKDLVAKQNPKILADKM